MEKFAHQFAQIFQLKFTDETADLLDQLLVYITYPKGTLILKQNDYCTDMYIIKKGLLRQFYYKDGRDLSEHFSAEDDVVFNIESMFLKQPSQLLIEALETSEIFKLNYESFIRLCDTNKQINQLYRRIFERDLIISQHKADSWRFENSKERYERFCREYSKLVYRLPIAQIASYLLMTPETLSRIRSGI